MRARSNSLPDICLVDRGMHVEIDAIYRMANQCVQDTIQLRQANASVETTEIEMKQLQSQLDAAREESEQDRARYHRYAMQRDESMRKLVEGFKEERCDFERTIDRLESELKKVHIACNEEEIVATHPISQSSPPKTQPTIEIVTSIDQPALTKQTNDRQDSNVHANNVHEEKVHEDKVHEDNKDTGCSNYIRHLESQLESRVAQCQCHEYDQLIRSRLEPIEEERDTLKQLVRQLQIEHVRSMRRAELAVEHLTKRAPTLEKVAAELNAEKQRLSDSREECLLAKNQCIDLNRNIGLEQDKIVSLERRLFESQQLCAALETQIADEQVGHESVLANERQINSDLNAQLDDARKSHSELASLLVSERQNNVELKAQLSDAHKAHAKLESLLVSQRQTNSDLKVQLYNDNVSHESVLVAKRQINSDLESLLVSQRQTNSDLKVQLYNEKVGHESLLVAERQTNIELNAQLIDARQTHAELESLLISERQTNSDLKAQLDDDKSWLISERQTNSDLRAQLDDEKSWLVSERKSNSELKAQLDGQCKINVEQEPESQKQDDDEWIQQYVQQAIQAEMAKRETSTQRNENDSISKSTQTNDEESIETVVESVAMNNSMTVETIPTRFSKAAKSVRKVKVQLMYAGTISERKLAGLQQHVQSQVESLLTILFPRVN